MVVVIWGAGIAQCLEHRTRDRKVQGLSHSRSGGIIFFSRVNFRYSLNSSVTAGAGKISRSFCQKCR